jgi:hypothetical protein
MIIPMMKVQNDGTAPAAPELAALQRGRDGRAIYMA